MIPISLSLEGFLSYQEPVEIDFTGFDLACITGENGAGKSSLLDAITWALFGRARKHDESIINLNSDRARVTLIFAYEGNQYRITRTNPRGDTKEVDLFIRADQDRDGKPNWNSLSERTIRETDQKVIQILRLDYESFINASFFLQGEADQFTQQTPSARKKILAQILGLEIWETYRKRVFEKRREAENRLSQLEGRLAEIAAELEQEQDRKAQLNSLEIELKEAQKNRERAESALHDLRSVLASLAEQGKLVDRQGDRLKDDSAKIDRLEQKLAARISEQEGFQEILEQADAIKEKYQEWDQARQSLEDWEATAEKFRESEIKRQEPLMQITAEKARLLQGEATLLASQKELRENLERIPQLQEELKALQSKASQAQEQIQQRDKKREELEAARQRQADARAENPRLFREMKDLKKRIQELEGTDGALCPLCGQELAPADRTALIEELQQEGTERGDRYRENQALLEEADQLVRDLQLQITQLSLAEKELRSLQSEIDRAQNQLAALEEGKLDWERNQQEELLQIQKTLREESYAPDAREELEKVNQELKNIGYDAAEHDRVRELTNQGTAIQERMAELEKAGAALQQLDREISEMKAQLEQDQKALERDRAEYDQAKDQLERDRQEAPDTRQAERDLLDLKEKENVLLRDMGAAQQKVAVLEGQKERQKELQLQRQALSDQLKGYRQLEVAFGKDGVPALLIEQALPNIESRANLILDRLTAGNMSVRFITQREYKSTNREDKKETLEIQIQDQSGVRDYELYSGGESFRINFAIRLALSHILAQRAGARLQTLVIDEGFGSQDSLGRQRLVEAINLIQEDFEKILVITHVEQIQEAFSNQLLVEKTPRGSQVTLV